MRGKIAALLALFTVFLFGAPTYFFTVRARAHAAFEKSLQDDIDFISRLSDLRLALRRIDNAADKYLITGQEKWLRERKTAMTEVKALEVRLKGSIPTEEGRTVWAALEADMEAFLMGEQSWIDLRASGKLPLINVATTALLDTSIESVVEEILRSQKISYDEIERKRKALAKASTTSFVSLLLSFLASLMIMGVFTFRQLVLPVRRELELSKLKTELVSMVGHEFGNAINIIQAATDVLRSTEGRESPEKRASFYAMLDASAQSLNSVVNNLLDLGRLESGRFAVSPKPILLRPLIQDCLRRWELVGHKKGIRFELELPKETVPVIADPDALGLAVSNLLSNAIKYTPEGGAVTLGVKPPDGGRVKVYVADTGIGIDAAERQKLTSAFYRAPGGKRVAKGFGLGLYIVREILEAHGSALELDSAVGKGSTFAFRLPVAGPAGALNRPA
jgi:signal transduction histidine kinase